MAGVIKVDTLQSDSNLALKIATANVAFIDSTGLNVVGGNLTIGATQFAEGGQVQTAGIADGAVTNDKIVSVANTKLSGLIVDSQIANVNASVISSGTLGAARLPAGSVLQVVNVAYGTPVDINTTNLTDTGLSASITPTNASSKILVLVNLMVGLNRATNQALSCKAQLLRGNTQILNMGASNGLGLRIGAGVDAIGRITMSATMSLSYLDSPATTSSTTYKMQAAPTTTSDSGGVTINWGDPDEVHSTITLIELAA
jgi:hypothetical protein